MRAEISLCSIVHHREERSDVAISRHDKGTRLLRYARNDALNVGGRLRLSH